MDRNGNDVADMAIEPDADSDVAPIDASDASDDPGPEDVATGDTAPDDIGVPDADGDGGPDVGPDPTDIRCPIRPAPPGLPPENGSHGDFTRIETPEPWDYEETCQTQSLCGAEEGVTYAVGPGRQYENPGDVPWLNLRPCDQVLVHFRPEPYTDIIYLAARGEAGRAIVLRGMPGPNGERPVIDGNDAVMPTTTGANQYVDSVGLLQIIRPLAGATTRYGYHPGYLLVSGLKFSNARAPAMVTDLTGTRRPWGAFTAGIYALGPEHLTINDCEFEGDGLGLFINSTNAEASQSRNILVRGNYFHGNGVVGGHSQHNAYTEAIGIIYEYNYMGEPVAGSGADNIKERSAGNIFRYNYLHGGINVISLRDPQSNQDHEAAALDAWGVRLASRVFIYGNVLAATSSVVGRNNSIIVGSGDGTCCGSGAQIRDGFIYFYGNRTYASLPAPPTPGFATSVPLFDLLNTRAPTTVVAVNNLFYAVNVPFALFYYQGAAQWEDNWINRFQLRFAERADGTLATGVPFDGDGLGGLAADSGDPGFVDASAGNYLTTPDSPFVSLSAPLPAEVLERGLAPQDVPVVTPYGR